MDHTHTYRFQRVDEVIEITFECDDWYADKVADEKLSDALFERGEAYEADEWERI